MLTGHGGVRTWRPRRGSGASGAAAVVAGLVLLVLFPLQPLVALVVAVVSATVLARAGWPAVQSPVAAPLVSYYALAAVTVLLTLDLRAGLRLGQTVVVVAALFVPAAVAGPEARVLICRFLVHLAGGLSLYAIMEVALDLPALWGPPPLNGQGEVIPMDNEILVGTGLGRAEATLVEPLLLSFLLVVALALALRPEVLPRRRTLVVGLLLGGLLASGSRSAAAVVVLLFVLAAIRSRRLRMALAAVATLAAAAVAVPVVLLRPDLVERVLANPSVAHRLEGVGAAAALVGEQPWWNTLLGNGYGQVLRLFQEGRLQSDGFYAVDNQFAHTFAELGLAGLVVLGWLLWRAFARTDRLVIAATAVAVVMFLSFDVLANASSLAVVVVLLGLTRRPAAEDGPPEPVRSARSDPGPEDATGPAR